MSGPGQTCAECIHYAQTITDPTGPMTMGRCHRYPPTITVLPGVTPPVRPYTTIADRQADERAQMSRTTVEWPRVAPADWCGEWDTAE